MQRHSQPDLFINRTCQFCFPHFGSSPHLLWAISLMAFYLRKSPHIATYFLFGRALAILRVPATQTWHGNQRKQKKMNKENTNDRGMAASLPWMCISNGGAEASRIIFQRNLRQWTSNEPIHCAHVWNCRIFIHFFSYFGSVWQWETML